MASTPSISSDIERIAAFVNALIATTPSEQTQFMARLRAYLSDGRVGLQRQAELFEALYTDAVRAGDLQVVNDLVIAILAQKEEDERRVQPLIRILSEHLSTQSHDPDLSFVFKEALEIVQETLKNFDAFRDRLLALAAEREGADKILRARRVAGGEVDYAELSREHIARYPKIRARLAE